MLLPRRRMTSAGLEVGPHVPANGRYGCFVNRSGAGLLRVVTVRPPGGWGDSDDHREFDLAVKGWVAVRRPRARSRAV